jgi:hypothetical protein
LEGCSYLGIGMESSYSNVYPRPSPLVRVEDLICLLDRELIAAE